MASPRSLLTLGCLLLAAGCAAPQAARPSHWAAEHMYQRPLAEVWPEAQRMLQAKGWRLLRVGDHRLVSEWRSDGSGALSERGGCSQLVAVDNACGSGWVNAERLAVVGGELFEGRAIVRIYRQRQRQPISGGDPTAHSLSNNVALEASIYRMGGSGEDLAERVLDPQTRGDALRTDRDLDLEWELIERLEPQVAARAEQRQAQARR